MKALIISADNFEDSELLAPYYRLQEAGIDVEVTAVGRGMIKGKHGYEVTVDKTLTEVNPDDYAILILPGGAAPASVRKEPKAIQIARSFFTHNKLVAAICHGPQILISAGLLEGRRATCYTTVVNELKECGACYEDREVVVDKNLITSRQPADLPAFMREIMKLLSPCRTERGVDMKGFVKDIEDLAIKNKEFRHVLYTAEHCQLVLMALKPKEEIGAEVHTLDQFFRVEEGTGEAVLNGVRTAIQAGFAVVVPAGANHNIINTGSAPLKLYTLYAPPNHRDGVVHHTRADAEADNEHFDGKTTE